MSVIKTATKISYLVILLSLTLIPLVRWWTRPDIDLSGIGSFAAGLGVPLGTLTVAMTARGISRDRTQQEGHGHE